MFRLFIASPKANQAKMQCASAGAGSTTHMACVVLNSAMGTNITLVLYRSTAIGIQDMVAGRIDFICEKGIGHAAAQQLKCIPSNMGGILEQRAAITSTATVR